MGRSISSPADLGVRMGLIAAVVVALALSPGASGFVPMSPAYAPPADSVSTSATAHVATGHLATAPATLHTDLEWSIPADSSVVEADLEEIHLRFTTTVEPAYTSLAVIGPNGEELETGELVAVAGTDDFEYILPLPRPLAAGLHTAVWRTVGTDGHPVDGSFVFTVEADEAPEPEGERALDATGEDAGAGADAASSRDGRATAPIDRTAGRQGPGGAVVGEGSAAFQPDAPMPVAVRWLGYIAVLLLIGASTFRLAVLGRAGARESPPGLPAGLYGRAVERARILALAALGLSLLTLPTRLWIRSTLLHGRESAWDAAALDTLLTGTIWGTGWLVQVAALVLIAAGLLLASTDRTPRRAVISAGSSDGAEDNYPDAPLEDTGERPGWEWAALRKAAGRVGWEVALLGTILLAAVTALSGHAAGVDRLRWLSVAVHTGHVLAVGVWLGTLAMLLFAGLPAALGLENAARWEGVARLAHAFSPVALLGAGLLLLTGVVNALFHISSFAELWRTSYGNVLLLKLALLSGVALTGLYNWKRVLPKLRSKRGEAGLRRSATIELGIAALVLLVTAILAALPTP